MKRIQVKLIWMRGHILQKCKSCEVTTGAFLGRNAMQLRKKLLIYLPLDNITSPDQRWLEFCLATYVCVHIFVYFIGNFILFLSVKFCERKDIQILDPLILMWI